MKSKWKDRLPGACLLLLTSTRGSHEGCPDQEAPFLKPRLLTHSNLQQPNTLHNLQPRCSWDLLGLFFFFSFYTLQKHVQIKHVEAWQHQNEEMQELRGLTGGWESRAHRSPLQEPAEVTHSQDRSVWSERSVESMELKIPFCTNTLQLKRSHIGKTSNFLGALQILESYFDISLCTYNTLTGKK